MDSYERYRKELDRIFQEIEEKEQRQKEAEQEPVARFIDRLLKHKSMKDLLAAVSIEQRIEIINACSRRWEESQATRKNPSTNN